MMVSYWRAPDQPVRPQQVSIQESGATHKAERAHHQDGAENQDRARECGRSSCSMRSLGQAAVLEPLRQALRPAADAHVLRALPHVEGVFALRVDVRLDGRAGVMVLAREIEQHVRHVFVVGRA